MSDVRSCGQCGVTMPDDSPYGVCPNCLMQIGLQSAGETGTQAHQEARRPFVPPKPHELAAHFPQLEILNLIGQGGMGAVYKARQVGLDRVVALKILPPHSHDDGSFATRFEREARAMARLNHPNIIGVFDSGHVGEFYYFVMEFVDGVNLREAINAGTLTPPEALAIVPQICDALQYAHDEGIVHRDIKPENVLIDKKGNTKIADFGLARLLGPTTDVTLTGTHQVMGTPRYMSPEQMEGSHEVDHRADIYSLGVVFYEILTGELPLGRFDGPSKKVQVDARLDEVVFRTLEKEPNRRYQHASEIKTDVQSICGLGPGLHGRHNKQSHSYEYKSEMQLFGWPLVHIAYGTDPKTGKTHRAKGIIAMGNFAYGVIAIGSFAVGGIAVGAGAVGGIAFGGGAIGSLAVGGGALGLFSFGGIAIGLILATGGLAVGLGLSYGGLAVGTVAQGSVAIGWFANAGQGFAIGAHALGSNQAYLNSPAENPFFAFLATAGIRVLFVCILMGAVVTFFTGILVSLRVLKRKDKQTNAVPPKIHVQHPDLPMVVPPARRSNTGLVVVVVAIGCFVGMCILPMLFLGWSYRRMGMTQEPAAFVRHDQSTQRERSPFEKRSIDTVGWITWNTDGPSLTANVSLSKPGLTAEQRAEVNKILKNAHDAYLQLEQAKLQQAKNARGHWVTSVAVEDANELVELENNIWTQIDEVVDIHWENSLRLNLNLQQPNDMGVLGFKGRQGLIEIWKVGSWFHWKVAASRSQNPSIAQVNGNEQSGPQLPIRLQRFWKEASKASEIMEPKSTEGPVVDAEDAST